MSPQENDGLVTAKQIKLAYRYNESMGFLVYAPRGWGKSSYKFHVAAEVLAGYGDPPNWEEVKKRIIFTPKEFVEMLLKTNSRRMLLLWDDAGFWLNRLFWYEPFVKETLRYMTLQRTQFAAIMFSTPSLAFLPSKLIELEDVYRVKIYKVHTNPETPNGRPRLAWVKRPWYSDDLKKHGVTTVWKDYFSAIMPDSFFEWYEPKREKYLELAANRIKQAIAKTKSKKQKKGLEAVEGEIGKTVPEPEKVDELEELIETLEVA